MEDENFVSSPDKLLTYLGTDAKVFFAGHLEHYTKLQDNTESPHKHGVCEQKKHHERAFRLSRKLFKHEFDVTPSTKRVHLKLGHKNKLSSLMAWEEVDLPKGWQANTSNHKCDNCASPFTGLKDESPMVEANDQNNAADVSRSEASNNAVDDEEVAEDTGVVDENVEDADISDAMNTNAMVEEAAENDANNEVDEGQNAESAVVENQAVESSGTVAQENVAENNVANSATASAPPQQSNTQQTDDAHDSHAPFKWPFWRQ